MRSTACAGATASASAARAAPDAHTGADSAASEQRARAGAAAARARAPKPGASRASAPHGLRRAEASEDVAHARSIEERAERTVGRRVERVQEAHVAHALGRAAAAR